MNSKSIQNFKYPLPYVSEMPKGAIISKFPKLKRRAFRIPELNALPRQCRFMMTKGRRYRADVVIGKRSGKI
jgi:hypothetical protein